MKNILKISLLALLTALCPAQGLAQKTKTKTSAKSAKEAPKKSKETPKAAKETPQKAKEAPVTVAQLTREYRFEEAMELLGRQIENDREKGAPTALAEEELKRATLGANMLRGTEKVLFVDSVVIPRASLLAHYRETGDGGSHIVDAKAFGTDSRRAGSVACVNDFGDRAIVSLAEGSESPKLHALGKLGGEWRVEGMLRLSPDSAEVQDFPFLLQDGQTLYYAAQGAESLGGYDIFVTRYDTEEKKFLKPENIGMPFNSPANDFLFAIDETRQIGFFVTDRRQPADSVCVYYFVPTESREVYDYEQNPDSVRRLARIHDIRTTQTDSQRTAAARQRMAATGPQRLTPRPECFIVLSDDRVCTAVAQLGSAQARRIATQWMSTKERLADKERQLDALRRQYAAGKTDAKRSQQIVQLEAETDELRASIRTMEDNIRAAENH